jgi:two-component system, NtrC family, sensor histidine kinase PilS
MITSPLQESTLIRQWQLLLIYNFYRIFCVLFFLVFFVFTHSVPNPFDIFYLLTLFVYFIVSLLSFYCYQVRLPKFKTQVLIAGILDIFFIAALTSFIGDMRSGFVVLLNVEVAALSILVPGRLAIFFASIASCTLLGISFIEFFYGKMQDLSTFYSSGIYGASIFATALTAWYLAHRVSISENIAHRRATELAGMQRINEYIVERLHSGVIYVDLERSIQLMNTAAKNFFNVHQQDSYHDLKQLSASLDKKCEQFIDKIQHDQRPVQVILDIPYLRVYFFAAAVDCQTAILIFLDDLSSIAQQAQQLKLASLGRLSASIAHELRNPLGAISHAVQLLGDTECLNNEDTRLKQLIINNCNRMNGVIKNILQLSRREQSKPQVIDFHSFILQFKHDFCVYNQCEIVIEVPETQRTHFVFDKSQLEQVLIILCENSIQHGRNADGKVTIKISLKENSLNTEIYLCDTGPGIPEQFQHDVFEPFFSTASTGFGMGLFIAKDLCEINQARLSMIPVEKGACFTITINHPGEMSL